MDTEIQNISTYSDKNLLEFFENAQVEYLHELKLYLDDKYYNTGESSGLTDQQYDLLKEVLVKRDPGYEPPVGSSSNDEVVKLPYFLGSAEKIKNTESNKLKNWISKYKATEYILEDKLDGVSCLLTSNKGKITLYKRGDGISGPDISKYAEYFDSIPKNLPDIAVRGELVMNTQTFLAKYSDNANPRNFVNGRTSGKTIRPGVKDIDFVAYEIMSTNDLSPSEQMDEMKRLGFLIVNYDIVQTLDSDELTETLQKFDKRSNYEIDGLIMLPNLPYAHTNDKYPKYMRAFKVNFAENIKETTVIEVKWEVSRYKILTPVVHIEPRLILGAVVSHPTGHNAKYILDNNIGPGTILQVTRSGAVIPYIVKVVKPTKAQMPDNVAYKWGLTEVDIYTEEESDKVFIKTITTFFSQLGIKHVGESTVAKLYEHKFDTLFKILEADKKDLMKIPRFGQKTVDRLYDNIHNGLKDVSLASVLGASGTLEYGIGIKRITVLLNVIPNLLEIYKEISTEELIEKIMKVDGFAYTISAQIANNVQFADAFVQKLSKYATFSEIKPIKIEKDSIAGQSKFYDKRFVFSGFRNNFLQDKIGSMGGNIMSSVSKKTTALIVKDKDEITTKITKANTLSVPVYTMEEFLVAYDINLPM